MLTALPPAISFMAQNFSIYLGNALGLVLLVLGYVLFNHFTNNDEKQDCYPKKRALCTEIKTKEPSNDEKSALVSETSEDCSVTKSSTSEGSSYFQERAACLSADNAERNGLDPVQQYNIFIRNNLIHRPNINPIEVLLIMKLEGLEPDATTYNTLLDITYRQLNYKMAEALYRELLLGPIKPDVITFNTKLKGINIKFIELRGDSIIDLQGSVPSCADIEFYQEMTYEVDKTVRELKEQGLVPNLITFNTLLELRFRLNALGEIYKIFEQMQLQNIEADRYTQTAFVKGIKRLSLLAKTKTSQKDWKIIFALIQTLKDRGQIAFDEQLNNIVIEVCFKYGFIYKAKELFQEISKNNDSDSKPSALLYSTMIRGLGQHNKLEEVMEIYQKMKLNSIPLNEVALGCLIDACVKCGDNQTAMKIIDNPENRSLANTVIYTTLMKGFTREKNYCRALEIFELMKQNSETQPNIISYNALLECAVQSEEFQEMDNIFKEMLEHNDPDCCPDLISYSTLIKGLTKSNQVTRAYQVFSALRSVGNCYLDEILYNSILDGLVKGNDLSKAQLVYCYMLEDEIKPSNVTYSILIKLFGKLGEVEKALGILDEMKQARIQPGVIVYTCLIQTCLKCKNFDLMLQLYQEMIKENVPCDSVFYNTLISGLTYNKMLFQAANASNDAFERRISLNEKVLLNLLKQLLHLGALEPESSELLERDISNVLEEIRYRKISLDPQLAFRADRIRDRHLAKRRNSGFFKLGPDPLGMEFNLESSN